MRAVAIVLLLFGVSSVAQATAAGAAAADRQWCAQDASFGICEYLLTPTSILGSSLDTVCQAVADRVAASTWRVVYDGARPVDGVWVFGQCGFHDPNGWYWPFAFVIPAHQIFRCQLPGPQVWQPGEPEVQQCPDPATPPRPPPTPQCLLARMDALDKCGAAFDASSIACGFLAIPFGAPEVGVCLLGEYAVKRYCESQAPTC